MILRVVLAFGFNRVGDLIDPPPNVARTLLARRFAGRPFVEVVPEEQKPTVLARKRRGKKGSSSAPPLVSADKGDPHP